MFADFLLGFLGDLTWEGVLWTTIPWVLFMAVHGFFEWKWERNRQQALSEVCKLLGDTAPFWELSAKFIGPDEKQYRVTASIGELQRTFNVDVRGAREVISAA